MIFALLCVFFVALVLIKYILHVKHIESYVKNVKSISSVSIPRKFFMGKSVQNIIEDGVKVILQNETPMKAQIGPVIYLIVDRPEDMQTILTSTQCLDKPYIYDFFYAPNGLINHRCM